MAAIAKTVAAPTPICLQVGDLCFAHRSKIILNELNFSLRRGEIFGILGPNGSGKSTLLHCISGLWQPQRGVLHWQGKLTSFTDPGFRQTLGVVFQESCLDPHLTVATNLLLAAQLYGIGGREAGNRIHELLQFTEVDTHAHDLVKTLSGGTKRRVELARSLIHKPEILLLDEPSAGLDFRAFDRFWQKLQALRRNRQLTVLLTTHRSEEAEQCCRLMIMEHGQIVCMDSPQAILSKVAGDALVIESSECEALAERLQNAFGLSSTVCNRELYVLCENGPQLIPRIIEMTRPLPIAAITLRKPTLAHAFLQLTGKALLL